MRSLTGRQNFWAKVEKTETCWTWTGAKLGGGHGVFGVEGVTKLAHRLSYEMAHGPIPAGFVVIQTCDNKACVNPPHLKAVTKKQSSENQRGARKDNASSGIRGVSWDKGRNLWRVQVISNGKHHCGGRYESLDDAKTAATDLRNELFTHNKSDRITP